MKTIEPRNYTMILFEYHESDDDDASIYGLTFEEVNDWIQDHNEYYETNYQTIQEFNDGEPYREFIVSEMVNINMN